MRESGLSHDLAPLHARLPYHARQYVRHLTRLRDLHVFFALMLSGIFGSPMREFWIAVSLLWLAGVGLRLTILAVPPVISLIQADLQLSGTEVGILTGLPIVLFGVAALPGSLL